MADDPQPRFWRALRARFRDERKFGGWSRAVTAIARDLWEYARESTPSRRRQRYGDIEFDWETKLDTTAASVGDRTRLAGALAGGPYQPIPAGEFEQSIGQLGIRYEEFTFIDLGSGKGRALLLAAGYPFRRIIGVEVLPELHRVAEANAAKFREARKGPPISLICGDAREFEFPPDPLIVFLFNPFPPAVFAAVLDRLHSSALREPRPLWVVYHNPVYEREFRDREWLQLVFATRQFIVYRAHPGER